MKKRLLISLITVGASMMAQGNEFQQPAHSYPEYNSRFIQNQLAPVFKPAKTFYVSLNGEIGTGTKKSPFNSLETARDAIRKLKNKQGLPTGGIRVVLLKGNYSMQQPFVLEKQDSGTPEAPIVYCGEDNDETILSGGYELDLSTLKTVEDKATLERLKSGSRGNVMTVDVPNETAANFPGDGKYGMISMDGYMLNLAQWPNRGYNHIDEIPDEGPTTRWLKPDEKPMPYSKENPTGGKFTTQETLSELIVKEFKRSGDMQAQGYFHNDWYYQREQVGGIEGETVQLLRYTRYGILKKIKSIPRRVRLVNVLAELDEPGEWYFDRIDNKLFFWPIQGFNKDSSRIVALPAANVKRSSEFHSYSAIPTYTKAGSSLIELRSTSYVTIKDLTIENTGGLAVRMSGGQYNLIAGCTIRNGINKGIAIDGGNHNGITGSNFHDLESAFTITGGDFAKLIRCYNFATNNDIHSCRRRGYGMINLDGVGIYFAHNVLHDMNGAVNYKTVDALIEYNEFYNIGYEMGDFNVAYCGAVWYTMNNVVRYNFVHHLLEPGGHPVFPFRNDDGGMGLQMYGNVFYRSGRGGGQFHGPLNSFQNNITMKANIMWWGNKRPITPEGIADAWKDMEKFGRDLPQGDKGDNIYIMEQFLGKEGWKKSPWIDEFPKLAQVIEINPFAATFSELTHNYIHEIRQPLHIHGGDGTIEGMDSNALGSFKDLPESFLVMIPGEIELDAFKDVTSLDFSFKKNFKPMDGFKPIPFENIGFVKDQFRPNPPKKKDYRSGIYQQFLNDEGGRYVAEKVNSRYPTPAYLK